MSQVVGLAPNHIQEPAQLTPAPSTRFPINVVECRGLASILVKQVSLLLLFAILPFQGAMAEVRSLVSGDDPAEVQENAYKRGMDYPVGPLKCSQRCSQWWGRE